MIGTSSNRKAIIKFKTSGYINKGDHLEGFYNLSRFTARTLFDKNLRKKSRKTELI